MAIRFCRDSANFEDRRDKGGTVLCTENKKTCTYREEFEPKHMKRNWSRLCKQSSVECTSFEDINGIVLCSKNHTSGVAGNEFRSISEELKVPPKNNHLKTLLTFRTLNEHAGFS